MRITVEATSGRGAVLGPPYTTITVKSGKNAAEHYKLSPAQLRWIVAYMIDKGHTLGVLAALDAMNDRMERVS